MVVLFLTQMVGSFLALMWLVHPLPLSDRFILCLNAAGSSPAFKVGSSLALMWSVYLLPNYGRFTPYPNSWFMPCLFGRFVHCLTVVGSFLTFMVALFLTLMVHPFLGSLPYWLVRSLPYRGQFIV